MGLDKQILLSLTKQSNMVMKINFAIFLKFIALSILGYSCLSSIKYLSGEINDTSTLLWVLTTMVIPWFTGLIFPVSLHVFTQRIMGVLIGAFTAIIPIFFTGINLVPEAQFFPLMGIMGGINGYICLPVGQSLRKTKK